MEVNHELSSLYESLVMSKRQGVEIDYCPKCRGVWLDRGGLDKILERSASEQRPAVPSYRQETPHDKHREKDHKEGHGGDQHHKKGFLHDLFD